MVLFEEDEHLSTTFSKGYPHQSHIKYCCRNLIPLVTYWNRIYLLMGCFLVDLSMCLELSVEKWISRHYQVATLSQFQSKVSEKQVMMDKLLILSVMSMLISTKTFGLCKSNEELKFK